MVRTTKKATAHTARSKRLCNPVSDKQEATFLRACSRREAEIWRCALTHAHVAKEKEYFIGEHIYSVFGAVRKYRADVLRIHEEAGRIRRLGQPQEIWFLREFEMRFEIETLLRISVYFDQLPTVVLNERVDRPRSYL